MDKISKFLARLSRQEFLVAEEVIEQILSGEIAKLDVKKLKGQDYFYRARKGRVRVIFWRKGVNIRIVAIENRNENTYRDF